MTLFVVTNKPEHQIRLTREEHNYNGIKMAKFFAHDKISRDSYPVFQNYLKATEQLAIITGMILLSISQKKKELEMIEKQKTSISNLIDDFPEERKIREKLDELHQSLKYEIIEMDFLV